MNLLKRIFMAFILVIIISPISLYNQTVTPFKEVNTKFDDRGISFRITNKNHLEIWRYNNSGCRNHYSKKVEKSDVKFEFSSENSFNHGQDTSKDVSLDGCITFPYDTICVDTLKPPPYFRNKAVFSSNRLNGNKDCDNDLYEATMNSSGNWSTKRIDILCSNFYDDTPALSPDGTVLYFSSTRSDSILGKTDLFYSQRVGDSWSSAKKLNEVYKKQFNETTPFVATDGYLYYASDESGDYDIWRIKINDKFLPVGTPEKLDEKDFPGVNMPGTNEFSPVFSPGGNFFVFSSNRNPLNSNLKKDYDIYYLKMNNNKDLVINLNIKEQKISYLTINSQAKEGVPEGSEPPCVSDLEIKENNDNANKINTKTDDKGYFQYKKSFNNIDNPAKDLNYLELSFKINAHCCGAKTIHTMPIDLNNCKGSYDYNIYINCEEKLHDTLPMIVETVPFFATGYWCPSTKQYQNFLLCNSISILLSKCKPNIDSVKFNAECKNNELYNYSVEPKVVVPEVKKNLVPCNCISKSEIKDIESGKLDYFEKVDTELVSLNNQMVEILKNPYVLRNLNNNKQITVQVFGWTDVRKLDETCRYTGQDIDLKNSNIELQTSIKRGNSEFAKTYINDGIIKKGIKFVNYWNKDGNQLLSDLRAYYMSSLLDAMWMHNISDYKRYRDAKLIRVEAVGRSIRNLSGISYALDRSVDVLVILNQGKQDIKDIKPLLNPDVKECLCKPEIFK